MSRINPQRLDDLLGGDELLTVAEISESLRVDEATVRAWCRAGDLEAVKVGGGWRIKKSSVQRFLEGDDDVEE